MFAFVLMPFDSKFDDIYKLGIKEIAEKLGITAERVDEQIFHKENILERIYSQINGKRSCKTRVRLQLDKFGVGLDS